MTFLLQCGVCCGILSIWAIIQLILMGVFYNMECVLLIEDVHAEEYNSYDEFIEETKRNYRSVAVNCWICAGMYGVMLVMSYVCYKQGKAKQKYVELKYADEARFCSGVGSVKRVKAVPVQQKREENKNKKEEGDTSSALSL